VDEGSGEIWFEIADVAETQQRLMKRNENYFAESGGQYEGDIKI
jgi:hypothetical protein